MAHNYHLTRSGKDIQLKFQTVIPTLVSVNYSDDSLCPSGHPPSSINTMLFCVGSLQRLGQASSLTAKTSTETR